MSPHAVPFETPFQKSQADLQEFLVTRNAFLPESSPLERLPDSYYEPWEAIARELPKHIKQDTIRKVVADLPVLSTDRLQSVEEWRRAYVILAFMTHAHIWGGDKPAEIIPPQISIPFLKVSSHLELPPVLSYAAANLWNFSCSGQDFTDLESLKTLVSFTGSKSEDWFLLISVAMEASGAGLIDTMLEALNAIKTRDYEVIIDALGELSRRIEEVGVLLERMYEHCDPMVFYHGIRPFLAGSKNMAESGLPRGVFFDEGDGQGEWRQLRGGSNGQSSLIQFFDVVLGVDHKGDGGVPPPPGEQTFHQQVRDYMPGPHARFLVHVERLGSIRELALAANTGQRQQQERLRAAYSAAIDALTGFRNRHIRIVTRYIILPSRQRWDGGSRQNLASASSSLGKETGQLTGTGGTALLPFLKHSRDETANAVRLGR
ncbi:unnamed protein product [Clonostachys solani]|uniref:Indoleamine 2,3-dioxygenase n=1 Tax=Clonostachys solani TaxID=160281 RepID=A0A9N9Z330_9HYPO|nr:unnamed protein product [Clonostachys solani]